MKTENFSFVELSTVSPWDLMYQLWMGKGLYPHGLTCHKYAYSVKTISSHFSSHTEKACLRISIHITKGKKSERSHVRLIMLWTLIPGLLSYISKEISFSLNLTNNLMSTWVSFQKWKNSYYFGTNLVLVTDKTHCITLCCFIAFRDQHRQPTLRILFLQPASMSHEGTWSITS